MSLTPPDEYGDSEPAPSGDEDAPASQSLRARAVGRLTGDLRAAAGAVRAGVVALLDAPSPPETHSDRSERSDRGASATSAQYTLAADESGTDSGADEPVATDAERVSEDDGPTSPPVVSASESTEIAVFGDELDGPDRDCPELKVQWHGDAVTFVSPDEPNARITSDVWEDVER
jgi:hypothetical protein